MVLTLLSRGVSALSYEIVLRGQEKDWKCSSVPLKAEHLFSAQLRKCSRSVVSWILEHNALQGNIVNPYFSAGFKIVFNTAS